jgi:hypothetical protein
MKALTTLAVVLAVAFYGAAADSLEKPKLKVRADGLPYGHETPEGVACDLARAFIQRDATLFTNTCIRLYGGGKGPAAYAEFLKSTTEGILAEAARTNAPPRGPKEIAKLFAARHLSRSGPTSYGYAGFGFQDIMFVDVEVILHGGKRALHRTLVIKDKDGKWYVHPAPDVSPLLSAGLNDESASEKGFAETYDVQKSSFAP